jgi:hypothetical protein
VEGREDHFEWASGCGCSGGVESYYWCGSCGSGGNGGNGGRALGKQNWRYNLSHKWLLLYLKMCSKRLYSIHPSSREGGFSTDDMLDTKVEELKHQYGVN